MKKQVGIYMIRNTLNKRVYVGATTDFEKRKRDHIAALNMNSHHNKHLQSDWFTYTEDYFDIQFVEACSEKVLYDLEEQYIKTLYDDQKLCYNVATPKMIGSLVSPTGMVVEKIHNIRRFCRENKVRRTSLQFLLRGLRKSADGWTVYGKNRS